jgi:curved DNA-binding protein CbpA
MGPSAKRPRLDLALVPVADAATILNLPVGTRVCLCAAPSRAGHVVGAANGWRRVIFDDATEASHRPGQLQVVVNTPVPCSLPVGTCVRLRVSRTRTGHVLSSNKSWRRVSFDDKREANHRVNELEETQLQIEANGARPIKRLRGKQPLQSSTAVVTYSEPGNAPPLTFLPIRQQASVGTSLPDIQVVPHYAMLRITPGACAEEVRGAYLRRALMTHPDKGGVEAEFNAVQEAYAVLGDPMKRAAYDRQWGLAPVMPNAVTRQRLERDPILLLSRLLELTPAEWGKRLPHFKREELLGLSQVLAKDSPTFTRTPRIGSRTGSTKGIYSNGVSYFARVDWRNLRIRSTPTPSLEQAIEWHAGLITLRGEAAHAFEQGASFPEAAAIFETSHAHWFESCNSVSGVRCYTPMLMDLQTIVDIRAKLNEAAATEKRSTVRRAAVERIKKTFTLRFEGFRKTADARRSFLFKKVEAELRTREADSHWCALGA